MFRRPLPQTVLLAALLLVGMLLPGLHRWHHVLEDAAHAAACVECQRSGPHHTTAVDGQPLLQHGHEDEGECALCELLLSQQPLVGTAGFAAPAIGVGAAPPRPHIAVPQQPERSRRPPVRAPPQLLS